MLDGAASEAGERGVGELIAPCSLIVCGDPTGDGTAGDAVPAFSSPHFRRSLTRLVPLSRVREGVSLAEEDEVFIEDGMLLAGFGEMAVGAAEEEDMFVESGVLVADVGGMAAGPACKGLMYVGRDGDRLGRMTSFGFSNAVG